MNMVGSGHKVIYGILGAAILLLLPFADAQLPQDVPNVNTSSVSSVTANVLLGIFSVMFGFTVAVILYLMGKTEQDRLRFNEDLANVRNRLQQAYDYSRKRQDELERLLRRALNDVGPKLFDIALTTNQSTTGVIEVLRFINKGVTPRLQTLADTNERMKHQIDKLPTPSDNTRATFDEYRDFILRPGVGALLLFGISIIYGVLAILWSDLSILLLVSASGLASFAGFHILQMWFNSREVSDRVDETLRVIHEVLSLQHEDMERELKILKYESMLIEVESTLKEHKEEYVVAETRSILTEIKTRLTAVESKLSEPGRERPIVAIKNIQSEPSRERPILIVKNTLKEPSKESEGNQTKDKRRLVYTAFRIPKADGG